MGKFFKEIGKMFIRLLPDKLYIKIKYRYIFGRPLNLNNPNTYSEKIQWLKLYDRRPEYTSMVDKYKAKEIAAKIIGEEHIIPTIGVWDKPSDIEWDSLPRQFVLKTTHGGGMGGVIICRDKPSFDMVKASHLLDSSMKQDLYKASREWPYKNIEKKIIAEEYKEDEFGELRDYKFFCFDGVVKALFVATERTKREEPFFNFFDSNYNPLPIKQGHPVASNMPPKPKCFDQMKNIAEKLSSGYPHIRIDLYEINGCVYFGEYTFYHFGGTVPFEPDKWDNIFGSWLKLPSSYMERQRYVV